MSESLIVVSESLTGSNDSLHSATKRGDEEAVKSLLMQRRDPDAVDEHGWTALHYACELGFLSIAELLLDHGASPHSAVSTSETALHIAAYGGHEKIVDLLLRNGADVHAVDKAGYSALLHAAHTPSGKTLKQLLNHGADISDVAADGQTALSLACSRGWSPFANFLIGCGADVHWVGTDECNRGYTLVHLAAQQCSSETIQLLLDRKVEVDAVTESGRTALHEACDWFNLNAAQCLLRNGANVSHPCRNGFTALHFVAEKYGSVLRGYVQLLELLVKNGADVNAEDEEGHTVLDLALVGPRTTKFKALVKRLMAMRARGLFVSENNLRAISEDEKAKSFSAACEEEIERMRKSAIGDSSVKTYDIFTKGANRLANYLSNENVERVLQSGNYRKDFPIYADAICEQLLQGRQRKDLLRQSSDWLWAVINEFWELPYVCVQKINRYLTNTDLSLQISHEASKQEAAGSQWQK